MGQHKEPGREKRGLRACFFGKLLDLAEKHKVQPAASIQIQILMGTTARAFGVRSGQVWYLHSDKALRRYADFTVACMRGFEGKESAAGLSRRLFQSAFRLGRRIRVITGFTTHEDQSRLVFFLYRTIGIFMTGRLPGEFTVAHCYFSRFYTPKQCALMSAMDAGIISGICGGGRLVFTERITEGCGRCHGCLRMHPVIQAGSGPRNKV